MSFHHILCSFLLVCCFDQLHNDHRGQDVHILLYCKELLQHIRSFTFYLCALCGFSMWKRSHAFLGGHSGMCLKHVWWACSHLAGAMGAKRRRSTKMPLPPCMGAEAARAAAPAAVADGPASFVSRAGAAKSTLAYDTDRDEVSDDDEEEEEEEEEESSTDNSLHSLT